MIVELLVSALSAVASFVIGLFPDLPDPTWLTDGVVGAAEWLSPKLAGFDAWIPFGAFGDGVVFVVGCLGLALTIKVVRIVASFFTAGGGSAA